MDTSAICYQILEILRKWSYSPKIDLRVQLKPKTGNNWSLDNSSFDSIGSLPSGSENKKSKNFIKYICIYSYYLAVQNKKQINCSGNVSCEKS